MTWWLSLFLIIFGPFVWWAMWREDFDGMRTESEMKRRPKLSLDEFYDQFYATSNVPRSVVSRILNITGEQFGIATGQIRPDDNFLQTDLADTMYYVVEIAEEFELSRSRQHELEQTDGTFDNIVRYVARQPEIAG